MTQAISSVNHKKYATQISAFENVSRISMSSPDLSELAHDKALWGAA